MSKETYREYYQEQSELLASFESFFKDSRWESEFDRMEDQGIHTSRDIEKKLDKEFFPVVIQGQEFRSARSLRRQIEETRENVEFLLSLSGDEK